MNNYNAGFASLVAKNWLGWKDKTETEIEHKGINLSITNFKNGSTNAKPQA